MNIKPFYGVACMALTFLAAGFTGAIEPVYAAPTAVAKDYSVLPETFGNRPDLTPNILIVLDTSGSMSGFFEDDGTSFAFDAGRADKPSSRSFQAREAFRNVLSNNVGNFNVGLMTYGGGARKENGTRTIVDCNDFSDDPDDPLKCRNPGTTNTVARYRKDNSVYNGKGLLVSELKLLDDDHLDELLMRLAPEPRRPTYTGTGKSSTQNNTRSTGTIVCDIPAGCPPYGVGLETFFSETNPPTPRGATRDPLEDGAVISFGSTALPGSLNSARAYLTAKSDPVAAANFKVNNNYAQTEVFPGIQNAVNPSTGEGSIAFPEVGLGTTTLFECRPNTYVFFLTDGIPSGKNYVPFEGGSRGSNLANSGLETRKLLEEGIQTWYFGFALKSGEKPDIEKLADDGGRVVPAGQDSAFFAANATELEQQLAAALSDVETQLGSASGLSVVTSSVQATGSVVQALYIPEKQKIEEVAGQNVVTDVAYWTGSLSMYFVDENGDLREDSNGNATLDNSDSVFELDFDPTLKRTRAIRDPGGTNTVIELDDLEPIWEAGEVLSSYDQSATNAGGVSSFDIQRDYNDAPSNENGFRHIFTVIDGVKKDFIFDEDAGIDESSFTRLALDSAGDDVDGDGDNWDAADQAQAIQRAKDLISYTRGKEGVVTPQGNITRPLRDRSIDGKPYILGDILHSTAVQVDVPNESRYLLYPETSGTYALYVDSQDGDFADSSGNRDPRRRMVYVGANDGMLHAFNAGKYDPNAVSFDADGIELGAEVWAYIPSALLPHLKWVAEAGNDARPYTASQHIAYMDGPVQSFDVQLWDSTGSRDSEHPGGWGTIIVAGMNLGGGVLTGIDDDADASTPTVTTRSTYVVLDVTNPDSPPTVLAEISDEELGFTTGRPTVVRQGNKWFLVFGSGPTELQSSTSNQEGRVYKYQLSGTPGAGSIVQEQLIGQPNSFVGDISAEDWNLDGFDESIYFGSVRGDLADPSGELYRLAMTDTKNTDANSLDLVFNADQPIPFRATTTTDRVGNQWLFFGSGRLYDTDDFTQTDQNTFYGMKEPLEFVEDGTNEGEIDASTLTEVSASDLVDVTGLRVRTDGTLEQTPQQGGTAIQAGDPAVNVTTFDGLKQYNQGGGSAGWKSNFDAPTAPDIYSLRNSAQGLVFRDFLFYTSFAPPSSDGNACTNEFGRSDLTAVDFATGTAVFVEGFDGLLGEEVGEDGNGTGFLADTVTVGEGIAATSSLLIVPSADGKSGVRIKVPLSTGEIGDVELPLPPTSTGRKSWTEIKF